MFQQIGSIVLQDTGQTLQWRHLHARTKSDIFEILHWAGDQHGGQAKGNLNIFLFLVRLYKCCVLGLGLHLKQVASQLPPRHDLHEPHRLVSSLTEYEHLHRLFRLCNAHVSRNIKKTAVSDSVKQLMRGLVCMEHPDFEGTLRQIEEEGGKAGSGTQHLILIVR